MTKEVRLVSTDGPAALEPSYGPSSHIRAVKFPLKLGTEASGNVPFDLRSFYA